MFSAIRQRFQKDPTLYYAMSIAATWAGVGSLMNGITVAQEYGAVPFLIWAVGNTLACVLFGLLAPRIPGLREVMRSRAMQLILGLMSVFQIWLSMNGIQSIFQTTVLGGTFGMVLAYGLAAFFMVLLLRYGMIRNVLTDGASWVAVYGTALVLTAAAILYSRGNMVRLSAGLTADALATGTEKAILLLPGAFLYPYFFEILDYNDQNEDGTEHISVGRAFCLGGLMFGLYLAFTFLLAWTNFSPALNVVKAVLVTLIGMSTLSSFLYSVYLTFGRRLGMAVNLAAIAGWQLLIPLGVMGVWTLMAKLRVWIVLGAVVAALALSGTKKRKAVGV